MQPPKQRKRTTLLISCVIFLVALNLRPAIVAVGPLLSNIGAAFGWGESLQGLLGALPLLAFALFSIFVSSITAKFDTDKVLFWALIVLAAGCLVRSFFGEGAVWAGTLLIGASIAVGNVLAPAIVKRDFSGNIPVATGAYSACVTSGSAIAGLSASAAADALGGWQPALALWALPALIAAILWLLRSRYLRKRNEAACATHKETPRKAHMPSAQEESAHQRKGAPIPEAENAALEIEATRNAQASATRNAASRKHQAEPASCPKDASPEHPMRTLLRRPSTWLVTLFMGLQSAAFYTFCNWLPSIATTAGFSNGEAGIHLFIFQMLGIFSGLAIPRFMYVRGNQICAGLLASAPLVVATAGWLFAPQLSLVWSIFGGVGQGASLVVALTLISLRGRTHAETIALSGFAQSLGYLIAACGPFVFGALAEATAGFAAPLAFMLALAVAQCAISVLAGKTPSFTQASRHI
jgi:CP family cyanate transporter-like MFS transporter